MLRNIVKNKYFDLLRFLRRDARLLDLIRRENHVVVLNLHQVSPHANPFWPPLAPEVFDDLLGFLKQHFEVVLFKELAGITGDKPAAVLSFDDGYYNFIEYAAPILDRHGLKANMNIIPECVESGQPLWNVKLYDFLNFAPVSLIRELELPGFDHRLGSGNSPDKMRFGLKISRFLKQRPRAERENLWPEIEKSMQKVDFPLTRMMDRSDVREIAKTHEVGAHSYSHESMGFEDNAFFEADLQKCSDYFDKMLEIPLEIYAFPNGSFRPEQIEISRRRGIRHQLLVGEKYADRNSDVFTRFTIYGASALEARFQALGLNNGS